VAVKYVSFEMVSLAKKGGLNWLYKTFFEILNIFSIESNELESLDVNVADQYTFNQLKYKTVD